MSSFSTTSVSVIDKIHTIFSLPISYNAGMKTIEPHIQKDLELIETAHEKADPKGAISDDTNPKSIYQHIFCPTTTPGKKIMTVLSDKYTTDSRFLKDTQHILKTYSGHGSTYTNEELEDMIRLYDEIKHDTGFKERYYYLDWEHLVFLNRHEWFMQFMSMYNITSPALTILFPFLLLVIPIFIIKIRGNELSMETYVNVLKQVMSNHALGKVFTQFNSVDLQQKLYLLISAGLYIFSTYQNVLVCKRFYNNMSKIYGYLSRISKYLTHTTGVMQEFCIKYAGLKTYSPFVQDLQTRIQGIQTINSKLLHISNLHNYTFSIQTATQIGYVMTVFYNIYENEMLNEYILYSFGFHGYIDNLCGMQQKIAERKMNFCTFIKKTKEDDSDSDSELDDMPSIVDENESKEQEEKEIHDESKEEIKSSGDKKKRDKKHANMQRTSFHNSYYPAHIGTDMVKNSYKLNDNMVITGPNASGKTTLLKTTLINILLSQQFGCGCYESAQIMPYTHLHCYLNIPDTQGRDSLLQAEARRCKEIIDSIENNTKEETHFCVFDELYSGTNPEEAVMSAYAVMDYLAKRVNVTTLLTTHYIELCNKVTTHESITNYRMKVTIENTSKEEINKEQKDIDDANDANDANDRDENLEYTSSFRYEYLLEKGISEIKGGIQVLMDMNYPAEILKNARKP